MIEHVSEDALLIRLGKEMDERLTHRIQVLAQRIQKDLGPTVRDLVPGYTTLLCVYDPLRADCFQMKRYLRSQLGQTIDSEPDTTGQTHKIPVLYEPQVGPDLDSVAKRAGLTVGDVIERHSQTTYHVYAMGFSPGFAFLGRLDPSLALPRRDSPRSSVPAGSVAIANRQTAVYPTASPGGWHIIGRSPLSLFSKESLALLSPGDRVRFQPMSRSEFLDQGGRL